MGYRRMNIHDLKTIFRHLEAKHSVSSIGDMTGFDRKTIREYRDAMIASGILDEPTREHELDQKLFALLPGNERNSPIADGFSAHLEELNRLLEDKDNPVKPKSAFLILKEKYDLPGGYESFKVFARKHHLTAGRKKTFPRIEMLPGLETQIDYGKVGLITDPETRRRRVVYAFVAVLSSSRHLFIHFVHSQNQESWVESNVCMAEYFNGVTEFLTIDNLKSGVIKADIYDPTLNRAYAEFAEHYGTFINPCIKGHSKGKAKVERMVPVARELFRRLVHLHPTASLAELNGWAKSWCVNEYGQSEHGTTGLKPFVAFEEREQSLLKPLNPVRFDVPIWKQAVVHLDQFFSFQKKRYAVPECYRNQTVHIRKSGSLLKIFDSAHRFIRQYVVNTQRAQWYSGDFPEDFEAMMLGEYPQYLIAQASEYGNGAKALIESILSPHAFLNARRARGMLTEIGKHKDHPLVNDICAQAAQRRIYHPHTLRDMLEKSRINGEFEAVVPRSPLGDSLVRNIEDLWN